MEFWKDRKHKTWQLSRSTTTLWSHPPSLSKQTFKRPSETVTMLSVPLLSKVSMGNPTSIACPIAQNGEVKFLGLFTESVQIFLPSSQPCVRGSCVWLTSLLGCPKLPGKNMLELSNSTCEPLNRYSQYLQMAVAEK